MHWARQYIVSMAPGSGIGGEGSLSPPPPKPHEVLMAAWEYTIGEKVQTNFGFNRAESVGRCFTLEEFSSMTLEEF